jgi:hypothetical protein
MGKYREVRYIYLRFTMGEKKLQDPLSEERLIHNSTIKNRINIIEDDFIPKKRKEHVVLKYLILQ